MAEVLPEPAPPAPYRVVSARPRTATITELWLAPLAEPLAFAPGQYVLLEDGSGVVPPRSYSIANAPRDDGAISLLVTRVAGGLTSPWVHGLRAGDEVSVEGPFGTFVDDPTATDPALLLAAGSGLAPIRALVEAALAVGRRRALTLIVSARTDADVIDAERFATAARDGRLRFVRTLTRQAGPPPTGRIPAVLAAIVGDLAGHDVFIAGAPGFVGACARAAVTLGAEPTRVRTEEFFVDEAPILNSGG